MDARRARWSPRCVRPAEKERNDARERPRPRRDHPPRSARSRWACVGRPVRREQDQGPRGARGGPDAAGDVHRLDRRAGAASPRVRGRRQLGRRGPGRVLQPRRGADPHRQLDHGRGQRPWHPRRRASDREEVGGGGRADQAPCRRKVRKRRLQGLGRSPRCRCVRGQCPVRTPRARDLARRRHLRAGVRARQAGHGVRAHRGDVAPRDQGHVQARPADLRRARVLLRHAGPTATRAGVPEQGSRDHAERRADREGPPVHVPLRGRNRRVRSASQPRAAGVPRPDLPRGREQRDAARDRAAVERLLQGDDPFVRQLDQHRRGRNPSRGVQGRADPHDQRVPRRVDAGQGSEGCRAVG